MSEVHAAYQVFGVSACDRCSTWVQLSSVYILLIGMQAKRSRSCAAQDQALGANLDQYL